MNRPLTATVLLASLLGACAVPRLATPDLVDARAAVRSAELDPAVAAQAPLELKRATDTLSRANALQAAGESTAEIDSLAHVARQQARTAQALARAKTDEEAVAGAVVERERARADMRTVEANRAKAQAGTAQAQASAARQQTAVAEQRASGAEQRATGAEQQTAVAVAAATAAQSQAGQLQQRLNELQAKQTERGLLVTLGDVLFEFNRAEVKPTAQSSLHKLADFLQQYPGRQVLIEGYTDDIGSATYNEGLSRRRADAVQRALIDMAVAPDRVSTVGYGEEYPISDNSSDTNRALNRRVEVYIADDDQPVRARR
jgi:outer membrane protein OmpA-like peptidoglycan-associated protein